MAGLTGAIVSTLDGDPNVATLLNQFKDDGKISFTIEDLLSRVRILRRVVGNGEARGLNATALTGLEKALCALTYVTALS
jgi:hypothetical protein